MSSLPHRVVQQVVPNGLNLDLSDAPDSAIPKRDCLWAAERYKSLPLNKRDPEQRELLRLWDLEPRRLVFFALAEFNLPSQIAERLSLPRARISDHLSKLSQGDMVTVRESGKNRHYAPTLNRLSRYLGDTPALYDIDNYFKERTGLSLIGPQVQKHSSAMKEVAEMLKSPQRLKVYLYLLGQRGKEAVSRTELEVLAEGRCLRTFQRDLALLERSGLICSEGRNNRNQQYSYRASVGPLITIINDLNDKLGEGVVISLTRDIPKDRSRLKSKLNSEYGISKACKIFSTLAVESTFQALYSLHKRGPTNPQCFASRYGVSEKRQEERRVQLLREIGLVRRMKTVDGPLLSVDWCNLNILFNRILRHEANNPGTNFD